MTAGIRTTSCGAPAGRRDDDQPASDRARRRARTLAAVALAIGAAGMQAAPALAAPASFATAVNLDSDTNTAHAVVVDDFNDDGRPDIATASRTEGLAVHLGTGGGAFGAVTRYAAPDGTPPHHGTSFITVLAGADLDNDGDTDLVSSDARNDNINIVWRNNGDGTFQQGAAVTLNPYINCGTSSATPCHAAFPVDVAVGDFNEDGKPDIATAATNSNNLVLVLGNGDGTFGAPTYLPLGRTIYGSVNRPISLASADIDGDGDLDLVSRDSSSYTVPVSDTSNISRLTDTVTILRGNGDGTFAAPADIQTGLVSSGTLALADVNADGRPDLLIVRTGVLGEVGVLLNDGTGAFGAPTSYPVPAATAVKTGDVNDDGHVDLVLSAGSGGANPHQVVVLLGNGSGGFGPSTSYGLDGATNAQAVAVADLNGDSLLDVVTANINTTGRDASVLLNTTRLTATATGELGARVPGYVAIEGGSASFGNVIPRFTDANYIASTSLKVATTSASGVTITAVAGDPANTNLGGLGSVHVLADVDLNDNDDLFAWFALTNPVPFYRSTGPVNTTTPTLTYRLIVPAGKVLTRGHVYSQPVTYTATSTIP